jgi:hypothetical protein
LQDKEKKLADEYNISIVRLDTFLANPNIKEPEILIPEGIKPSEIRKCVK